MKTVAAESAGFSPDRLAAIRPAMQEIVERGIVPGIITLVARHGEVVHCECVGVMDIKAQTPLREDAIVRLYSMTKPVTAVATLVLVEQGLLRLSDPIAQYIPAFAQTKVFVRRTPAGDQLAALERPITVQHLLTHTAGLSYGFFDDTPVEAIYRRAHLHSATRPMTRPLDQMAAALAALPLVQQPGTVWRYSMANDLLGYLISIVSGMSFDAFLTQRLFEPLGMVDTGFYVPAAKRRRLATLYSATASGALLPAARSSIWRDPAAPPSGGAGLLSTAADYLRFARMLLGGGTLDGVRILKPETVALMTRNHLPESILPFAVDARYPALGYGYGLGVSVLLDPAAAGDPASAGTYQWSGAAKTRWWNDPKQDLIGLMMVQVLTAGRLQQVEEINLTFRKLVYQSTQD